MNNIKNSFFIGAISIVFGSLQMTFFLSDGISCSDGKSSLLDGILFFMPIQFAFIFILSLIRKKIIQYLILVLTYIFWIYINKYEFEHRYACWSTFSNSEILKSVLLKSSFTCSICLLLFYFFTKKYFKK